jgi:hypothetical protein
MAVAAPKRRSASQAAPAPSRTAPPEPKKRPRDRPRPGGSGRSTVAAPAAPAKRKPVAPKRKTASTAAPARKVPARRKATPKRRPAGVIPIAAGHAGRAAVAVTQLPESGLIHRLTRGRAWIGVLGVLLVGIVALNVVTLSFAASSGKVDAKNTELSKENSMLQGLVAEKYGQARLRHEASKLGLGMSTTAVPQLINGHRGDVAEAAARLAAAGTATAGSTAEASGKEAASGEEVATGEEATAGATSEGEFTAEEEAIYNREWEESLAAEGAEAGASEAPVGEEVVTEVPTE